MGERDILGCVRREKKTRDCFSEKVDTDVRCGHATECDRPLGVSSCNNQGQHDFRQFLQGEQLAERCRIKEGGKVTQRREKLGEGRTKAQLWNCSCSTVDFLK